MFIPDPDFYPSRISDPGSRIQKQQQKREVKKNLMSNHKCQITKFNKIVNYFSFEVLKKKIWANFQRIIELFTKKIVKKLFKVWSWDPRSGIRKKPFRIPDPGVKKAPDPGSGSATLYSIIPLRGSWWSNPVPEEIKLPTILINKHCLCITDAGTLGTSVPITKTQYLPNIFSLLLPDLFCP
jgi:hypothetical protein